MIWHGRRSPAGVKALAGAVALAWALSGCSLDRLPTISSAGPKVAVTFAAAASAAVADVAADSASPKPAARQDPFTVVGSVADDPVGSASDPSTTVAPTDGLGSFPSPEPGKAHLLVTISIGTAFPAGTIPAGWRSVQVIPLGTALIRLTLDGPRLDAPITYEVEPPPPGVTYKQQLFTGLKPGASYMVTALCLNAAGKSLASGFKNNLELALGNNALNLPMALEPFDAGLIF